MSKVLQMKRSETFSGTDLKSYLRRGLFMNMTTFRVKTHFAYCIVFPLCLLSDGFSQGKVKKINMLLLYVIKRWLFEVLGLRNQRE